VPYWPEFVLFGRVVFSLITAIGLVVGVLGVIVWAGYLSSRAR
jgi:hypothetical protein